MEVYNLKKTQYTLHHLMVLKTGYESLKEIITT